MGTTGFVFITTAFLGLLMHTNLSPAGILTAMSDEYSGFTKDVTRVVAEDIRHTKDKFNGGS